MARSRSEHVQSPGCRRHAGLRIFADYSTSGARGTLRVGAAPQRRAYSSDGRPRSRDGDSPRPCRGRSPEARTPAACHQTNPSAFLKLINKDAASTLPNRLQREVQLVTAIAASGTKHVAGEALRMDADERSVIFSAGRRSTHNERQHAVGLVFGLETED